MILGLEFEPVSRLVDWKTLFGSGPFAPTRVFVQIVLTLIIVAAFYVWRAARRRRCPGARNIAESAYDFIQDGVILQTMAEEGLSWTTFLITFFSFILVLNIWEIIPGFQMPVTAHIAIPARSWPCWCGSSSTSWAWRARSFGYFKNMGVLLCALAAVHHAGPILSSPHPFGRPLSLSVLFFACMLAGHLLLATFAVLFGRHVLRRPAGAEVGGHPCLLACSWPSPASRCWLSSFMTSSSPSSPPCTLRAQSTPSTKNGFTYPRSSNTKEIRRSWRA